MSKWLFVAALVQLYNVESAQENDIKIENLAKLIEDAFETIVVQLDADGLSKRYMDPLIGKLGLVRMDDEFEKRSTDRIVERAEELVGSTIAAVTKIREKAENYYEFYNFNSTYECFINNVGYTRAKAITQHHEGNTTERDEATRELDACEMPRYVPMKPDPILFNMSVTRAISTAHVPTNVYDGSVQVQNVAEWTRVLDPVFKKNAENDTRLKWQYFGSESGLLKIYPGIMWHIQNHHYNAAENPVDFFDCRLEDWYVQAATYSKDVVILVDSSGSMTGRRKIIANNTVGDILNTLTENDFFNVLIVSVTTTYADPMFNKTLIPATIWNKRRVAKNLHMKPSGIAMYKEAFTEAFKLFEHSRRNTSETCECNQVLMIITDGAIDNYEEIIQKYNRDPMRVRIFTFLIGHDVSDKALVQRVACNNRGYFTHIATLADVRDNVQTYIPVVARTNALLNDHRTIWTSVHSNQMKLAVDGTPAVEVATNVNETEKPKENPFLDNLKNVRMFTSAAQAVFDRQNLTLTYNNARLLGVAGIDIAVSEFEKLAHPWEIGVNSHAFAINNNGFVIFHPDYRPVHKGYTKPYYQNLDISKVEIPVEAIIENGFPFYNFSLRSNMLSREPGDEEHFMEYPLGSFTRLLRYPTRFLYRPIANTPFTLAVAFGGLRNGDDRYIPEYPEMPTGAPNWPVLTPKDLSVFAKAFVKECAPANDSTSGIDLTPIEFCQFDLETAELFLKSPLCALRRVLLSPQLQKTLKCDASYLSRAYSDATITSYIADKWETQARNPTLTKMGVELSFLWTSNGLIRWQLIGDNAMSLYNKYFLNSNRNTVRSDIYRYASYQAEEHRHETTIIWSPPAREVRNAKNTDTAFHLTVARPVVTRIPGVGTGVAVLGMVGAQIEFDQFREWFSDIAPECASDANGFDTRCYLVDRSGIIVFDAREKNNIGITFEAVECAAMKSMGKQNLFQRVNLFDFQAICTHVTQMESSANILLNPLKLLFSSIFSIVHHIAIFMTHVFYFCWTILSAMADEIIHVNEGADPDSKITRERLQNISRIMLDECQTSAAMLDCINERIRSRCSLPDQPMACVVFCDELQRRPVAQYDTLCPRLLNRESCGRRHAVVDFYANHSVVSEATGAEVPLSGAYECGNCSRTWYLQHIKKTNLMLIVVKNKEQKSCFCPDCPVLNHFEDLEVNHTSRSPMPYRQRPPWNCHPLQEKENTSRCTSGAHIVTTTPAQFLYLTLCVFYLYILLLA